MAQSLITPSGADWTHRSAEPTAAEQYVAAWFEERLPPGWEIYIRPYLNGPTPSLVLLHPQFGIAVYEVVDWDPEATRYGVRSFPAGKPVLLAGDTPLEGLANPYLLARHYKYKIAVLSTHVIGNRAFGLITAGVIFTRGVTGCWEELLSSFRARNESKSRNPIIGADDLEYGNIDRVLRRARRNTAQVDMTGQVADLLRIWLSPPDFSHSDNDPLALDAVQSALVRNDPGVTGYRRVKGPAGSGKSVILAQRAAVLALRGKRVLMTCFNITMTNYLGMQLGVALQRSPGSSEELDSAWRRVKILHYYDWAGSNTPIDDDGNTCLDIGVCHCPANAKYDAVMVDEGQDFKPAWWQHMRLCALADGAEVLFAADTTQDLYGRFQAWTDAVMHNAGFRGPWNTLEYSYRVPSGLVPALRDFCARFMPNRVAELPAVAQGELSDQYPVAMRWVQVPSGSRWGSICRRELRRVRAQLPAGHKLSDVAFLFWGHEFGFKFVSALSAELNGKISHIFVESDSPSERQVKSRPLKRAFPQYGDGLRAITVHSYKGWEAKHLLIYVQDLSDGEDGWSGAALFYVALTRLLRDTLGSSLTVVSSCDELADFGRRYFSDYEDSDDHRNHPAASHNRRRIPLYGTAPRQTLRTDPRRRNGRT